MQNDFTLERVLDDTRVYDDVLERAINQCQLLQTLGATDHVAAFASVREMCHVVVDLMHAGLGKNSPIPSGTDIRLLTWRRSRQDGRNALGSTTTNTTGPHLPNSDLDPDAAQHDMRVNSRERERERTTVPSTHARATRHHACQNTTRSRTQTLSP